MTANWEEVDVPRGAYISWGNTVGQHVTGNVVSYSATGGTDYNENVCPQLVVELTDAAASFNKAGERTDFPAGEMVVLNAGLVSLGRAMRAARPEPGDLIKITFSGTFQAAKGPGKEFSVKIARGAGNNAAAAVAAPAAPVSAAPPF